MAKPVVLHLGDPVKYNHDFHDNDFLHLFTVVRNDALDHPSFIQALKEKQYGDFVAIFRPHFQSGGEMGQWDDELISLLHPPFAYLPLLEQASTGLMSKRWDDVESGTRMAPGYRMKQSQIQLSDPGIFTATHKLIATISHNPSGHILGLVGLGNISKKVALKAQALGMAVHYYDVVRQSPEVEKTLHVTFHDTLESLLKVSDCASLHTPLNQHTRHLINSETLNFMKAGARLVNTARGEVVEEGEPAYG
ncbi:hypothetical protein BDV12DRAFT_199396 [Aspergillus spectabilis]